MRNILHAIVNFARAAFALLKFRLFWKVMK
jgi:hypothetical protein